MSNHFHLVLETPQPNLVLGMKWLLGVYTKRYNIRHRLCGHLFAGRYKALVVDGSGNGYLRTVGDYVHLNPVRARLLREHEPLQNYPWSSYGEYLRRPEQRPGWLRVDRLLGERNIAADTEEGRKAFAAQVELRRAEETTADYEQLRRDWILGSEEFRQELLAAAAGHIRRSHYGAQRRETSRQKAERILREELLRLGCQEEQLLLRRKGDAAKVAIARRLRKPPSACKKSPTGCAWAVGRMFPTC